MAAVESGSTMRRRMPKYPSPSISAASSISLGMLLKKVDKDDKIERVDGEGHQHGRPRPHKVKAVEQQVVWDQAAGEEHRHHDHFRKELIAPQNVLESGYAIRLVMMSAMAVPPTAYKNVLPYALKKFG